MIEELKKIKLAEIEEQIKSLLENTESTRKFNWFEKIFKKKEYEAYLNEQQIATKMRQEKIKKLEEEKEKCRYALTIQALGLDLQSAVEILKKHGKPIIISKSDINRDNEMTKPYVDNLDGIILVHKTAYAPTGSKIKTQKDSDVYAVAEFAIDSEPFSVRFQEKRDTIHFALNGEVTEHLEGSEWDKTKYAILIPFRDIPKEQYASVCPNDTYTNGSVNLTNNAWILVPKGEGEKVKKNNPNVNVIEYDGPNVTGYADHLVRMMGYSFQTIEAGSHGGWRDKTAQNILYDVVAKEGFKSETHYFSKEKYEEDFNRGIQFIIEIIKHIERKPELLKKPEFVEGLQIEISRRIPLTSRNELFQDVYNALLSAGYELPQDELANIARAKSTVYDKKYTLVLEIIKIIMKNNSATLTESQGIKK